MAIIARCMYCGLAVVLSIMQKVNRYPFVYKVDCCALNLTCVGKSSGFRISRAFVVDRSIGSAASSIWVRAGSSGSRGRTDLTSAAAGAQPVYETPYCAE
jgi:hypothetical protein